ncbi:MAG TPA: enoyl-CoA hydratase/isomerase family protein [Acetobacteraceae bacterium]|nr:enoyl-CoA hydratase/isomerase family protein [Acetobacteraceae bacterium]
MPQEASVVTRRDGRAGRILLNRPQALNALDLAMIRVLTRALSEWHDDPHIHLVVIEGAGDRAFCAGGDIRALRDAQLGGNRPAADAFFSEEYALNRMIATYPKPYVALIDGICMGGGIGVSVHAPYRVATEHAMFAMPETAIGFFPDIGATFFLPRLPGRIGCYLGLSGARMQGADAVHAGLATHFCPRAQLAGLSQALAADGAGALAEFAAPLPAFSLAAERAALDQCFGADTVPEILTRLAAEDTAWAKRTLEMLRGVSPSALCWTLKALQRGGDQTLPQALDDEFALTHTTMAHPDFAEGVRAMVVDKDRRPRWQPAQIEEVDPAAIVAMFEYRPA